MKMKLFKQLKTLEKVESMLLDIGYDKVARQIRNEIIKINKELYDIDNKE